MTLNPSHLDMNILDVNIVTYTCIHTHCMYIYIYIYTHIIYIYIHFTICTYIYIYLHPESSCPRILVTYQWFIKYSNFNTKICSTSTAVCVQVLKKKQNRLYMIICLQSVYFVQYSTCWVKLESTLYWYRSWKHLNDSDFNGQSENNKT